MAASTRLLNFFLGEIEAEERAGFPRLGRIPDSGAMAKLRYYRSLGEKDRYAFRECCAHWACSRFGFVIGTPPIDPTQHPFFEKWLAAGIGTDFGIRRSVPHLRAAIQQYKVD